MRTLICLTVLLCTPWASAQTDSCKSAEISERASDAYRAGDHQQSVDLYLEALECPDAKDRAPVMYYNLACAYALLEDADRAFEALRKSIELGYDNLGWIQKDSDFTILKEKSRPRFDDFMAWAEELTKANRVRLSPKAIVEYDNFTGPRTFDRHHWDPYDLPEMDTLRSRYDLNGIIADSATEFGRICALLDWVSNRWEHTGDNQPERNDALTILKAVDAGEHFRCVEYATVLTNCLTAVGYPARRISLSKETVAYGTGKGHVVTEVWSNDHNKWIVLDGQNDAFWVADGTPLGAVECQRYWLDGRLDELTFVGMRGYDYEKKKSSWAPYFQHVKCDAYNIYFDTSATRHSEVLEYLQDGVIPEIYFQGYRSTCRRTSDLGLFNPPLNQTYISIKQVGGREVDTLTVRLSHTMPFFERFLVRIDDGDWQEMPNEFAWPLNPGDNALQARAVNKAGVQGRPSRLVLRNN
jgi:hypothetical protein